MFREACRCILDFPSFAAAEMPLSSWTSRLTRVLLLRDYNTRVVLLGTLLLGVCAGVIGVFMLLRRRSLVGDVVGHASLPGIAITFLVLERVSPGAGRSLPALLTGAFVAGMLGVCGVVAIRTWTRIREDAALAIVLSLFFGLGVALFTVIQSIPGGNAAGLNQFIFGKAASLVSGDVWWIAAAALVTLIVCGLLFKELTVLSFDEDFARAQGWPVVPLDLMLMTLVGVVTVIGLQSVGLLLVVALLVIPPASARFWTNRLDMLTVLSGAFGGLASAAGVVVSALFPRIAAGAVIVLCGSFLFVVSLLLGRCGGVVSRARQQREHVRRTGRIDLLRAFYELGEMQSAGPDGHRFTASMSQLHRSRDWPPRRLKRFLASAIRDDLIAFDGLKYWLTALGEAEAARVVRNHRLWEAYLIAHADVAPSQVDRFADRIEHVLDADVLRELEQVMARRHPQPDVPPSPHPPDERSSLAR